MNRVRRFQIVLSATGDVIADGAWFALDDSAQVAFRGGQNVRYEQGPQAACSPPNSRIASHVEWLDES